MSRIWILTWPPSEAADGPADGCCQLALWTESLIHHPATPHNAHINYQSRNGVSPLRLNENTPYVNGHKIHTVSTTTVKMLSTWTRPKIHPKHIKTKSYIAFATEAKIRPWRHLALRYNTPIRFNTYTTKETNEAANDYRLKKKGAIRAFALF